MVGNELNRRRFLAGLGTTTATGLAGCAGIPGFGGDKEAVTLSDFRGSGPLIEGRPAPGGTSIEELPDLSGSLTLYLGGGESGLYRRLFDLLRAEYPDFTLTVSSNDSSTLAQQTVAEYEAGALAGDVFLPVDAGSMGVVADAGATTPLPETITGLVPETFRSPDRSWVGIEGRARSIPYNTDQLSPDDIPDAIGAFPDTQRLHGAMGWAPTYGAFHDFITAMRILRGPQQTKDWLTGMMDAQVARYPNEFFAAQAVTDGAIDAAFTNHYYALRVQNANPDAPLALAFTEGDAGALVNVSTAAVLANSGVESLATNFVHHLLSAEAQEFFATVTNGYPMIEGVAPIGDLPTIAELNPPDLDLTRLANLTPTLDLLREVGLL
ncbi:MAG: extracellular solute-binding protein [Halobacteriaceae archaeon]